jgi:serine/threonine protein kinase/Tol biopolymer transport system component
VEAFVADDLVGKQFGQYEILEVAGWGRVASVYRARQLDADRVVAIKVLPREFTQQDEDFTTNFAREVRVIARLQHYHILPIYDVGLVSGMPYIVMRYMPGGTLLQRLVRETKIAPKDCVPIIQQVAAALDHIHQRGLIHRDVKPHNILFDEAGDAFLSDFSIASVRAAQAEMTGSTVPGMAAYVAPEMLDPEAILLPSADIYSLGVTLFHMLTGSVPFQADTPDEQAQMHLTAPVPSLQRFDPNLTQDVEIVVLRTLGKKPEERLETAGDVARELARATGVTTDATRQLDVTEQLLASGIGQAVPVLAPDGIEDVEVIGDEDGPEVPTLELEIADVGAEDAEIEQEIAPPPVPELEGEPETDRWSPRERQRRQKERERVRKKVLGIGTPWYTAMLSIVLLLIVWFVVGTVIGFEVRRQANAVTLVAIHGEQTQVAVTETQSGVETLVAQNFASQTQAVILSADTATAQAPTDTPTPTETPTPTLTPTPTPFGGSLGRIALVSNRDGDPEIYLLDLDTDQLTRVTDNGKEDSSPSWSPDGEWLAYDSLDTLQGRHIFVVDNQGQNRRELTDGIRVDRYPLWSSDGKAIVFFSTEGGRFYVRSITLDGNERDLLQLPIEIRPLDWSPNNRILTAYGRDADRELEILSVDLANGQRTPITSKVGLIDFVSFSPDRSKVAYIGLYDSRRQLFLADTNCEFIHECNAVRLTDDLYNYYTPRFSPDGSLILVASNRFNNLDLWVLDLNGDVVRQVTESPFDEYDGVWQPASAGP